MAITGGFGVTLDLQTGAPRRWYVGRDGVKRWADNDQPVDAKDTQLWALLIEGPDDLYAMPSRKDAEAHANILRPHFERITAKKGVTLNPKVVPWPHSIEAHAANMREHLTDLQDD